MTAPTLPRPTSRPLTIMHVLKHAVRGNGGVHVAVDLACAQSDRGHHVVFASTRGSYDDLLRRHGVEVVDVPEATGKRAALRAAASLARLALRRRPDVIHAHMMSSALLCAPIAKLSGASLVTTVHNSFDPHSVIMRLGRVVIAVSDAERRLLLSRGFPARKVITILNGAGRSPREELPYDDIGPLHTPAVVTLSGLHPRKAVDDVVRAFAGVSDRHRDWHLNVVGWGPDRESLEALVAELGLVDRVHFLGSTLTPGPLLEQAAVFATASLADPCPLTVTEARVAGCAVVGTRVGGIPEMLEAGRAGQLVAPSAPAEMAAVLDGLMSDAGVLQEWQARARRGADYFTVDRVAADHLAVYASLRSRRGRRSGRQVTERPRRRRRVGYFVSPSQHFAGIERVVHEIASGLSERHGDAVDVHVVFASDYDEPLLQSPSYSRHVLGVGRLRGLAVALRRTVAELDLDVLVVPQVEASVVAWFATRFLGLDAFVTHLHGNPQVEERDGTRRTRVAFALFRHLVGPRVAAILAVSPSLAAFAAGDLARRVPTRFVPNPVRTLPRPAPASGPGDGVFRFVNVARLSYQKGQDLLLEAVALARAELPPFVVQLVGDGPAEDDLRRQCTRLGLDDVVEFVGYCTEPAVVLSGADCFVLSSRWEGFGVALVEALQLGLPVLALDCDFGPADVLTSPALGTLVRPDAPSLAQGLVDAARRVDDDRFRADRRRAAAAYDAATATDRHYAVLDDLTRVG